MRRGTVEEDPLLAPAPAPRLAGSLNGNDCIQPIHRTASGDSSQTSVRFGTARCPIPGGGRVTLDQSATLLQAPEMIAKHSIGPDPGSTFSITLKSRLGHIRRGD